MYFRAVLLPVQSVAFFEPAFGFVANSLRILSLKAVRDEASGVVLRLVIVVVMMVFVACVRVLCVCSVRARVLCVCGFQPDSRKDHFP